MEVYKIKEIHFIRLDFCKKIFGKYGKSKFINKAMKINLSDITRVLTIVLFIKSIFNKK